MTHGGLHIRVTTVAREFSASIVTSSPIAVVFSQWLHHQAIRRTCGIYRVIQNVKLEACTYCSSR
jgi:hypothetical protein